MERRGSGGRKRALITGASGGIGRALAEEFARNQFDLILAARSGDRLSAVKEELAGQYGVQVEVRVQDMTEEDAAERLLAQTEDQGKQVDVLVNNAGFGDHAGFVDADWERQRQMVELNILALMRMTQLFAKRMRKRGYGRILNLSSVAAFFAGPYMSVYYASKAFVLSFSEAVDEELEGTGVHVTVLCPGPTATGFEAAAGMEGSKMFSFAKPQTPEAVARAGFRACMAGQTVRYHGPVTKLASIGARLLPRRTARRLMKRIDGTPEG